MAWGDQPDRWKAPGSGTPLEPNEAAQASSSEIAKRVVAQLIVPRGPLRTVSTIFGLVGNAVSANALNSIISLPLLAAPGLIRTIDFLPAIVTTGAASGIMQLFDNDTNSPLLRSFAINVGAAGSYSQAYSANDVQIPFLRGILAVWTPLIAAFGASLITVNIDFESIPIGQKLEQS